MSAQPDGLGKVVAVLSTEVLNRDC